jgi:phage FluMu protein Com
MDIEKGNIKIHKTISEILKKEISLYDEGKCPTCSTDFKSEHFVNLRKCFRGKKNTILEYWKRFKLTSHQ